MIKKITRPVVGILLGGVMLSAHADFIDDSHADLTLLNRYLDQEGRGVVGSTAKAKSVRDWGQGFQFNFKSGYTEGAVGFGLDLEAFYGIKLNSSGTPGSMFPLDDGKSANDFGVLSPTFKMRFLKDELRIGELTQSNPMLANTDGRCITRPTPVRSWCPKTSRTSPSRAATSPRRRFVMRPTTVT